MISLRKYWSEFGGPKQAACLLVAGAFVVLASCGGAPSLRHLKGDAMGTFYTVHFWGNDYVDSEAVGAAIDRLLDAFESELSNWRGDSWVSRFNEAPANVSIPVPEHAFQVLDLCLELAELSEGRLDPTISPLVELWGFGPERGERVPDVASIRVALQNVGYRKLVLDRKARTVLKTQSELRLNCSAVAKGYAVDRVAGLLESKGIDHFLVNIGGEVRAKGVASDGKPWQVGIQTPGEEGRRGKSEAHFPLSNRSMATSGHSQRAFVVEGRRYSHILDPRTGWPVSAQVASVTVLAPTCALADGLATLALILDEARMAEVLSQYEEVEMFRLPWP